MRKLDPKKHPKLIAFLEKAQKILKTVAVICFSLVIVLCVFFYSKACADKNTAQLISASAEASTVAETASDVESGIDLTQYPSANLFHLLDKKSDSVAGNVVISTSFSGKVTIKGTATQGGGRTQFFSEPVYLEAGKTYTKSRVEGYSGLLYLTMQSNLNKTISGFVDTFTVDTSGYYCLGFNMEQGRTYDLEFYPMLNVGDTLYPFTPNLNAIYNGGYNAGYDVGETDGKEIGFDEGLNVARSGFWSNCTVSVTMHTIWSQMPVEHYYEFKPTYTTDGIDLSFLYGVLLEELAPDETVERVSVGLYFNPGVLYDNVKIRAMGDSTVLTASDLYVGVADTIDATSFSTLPCRFSLVDGSVGVYGLDIFTGDAPASSLYGKYMPLLGYFQLKSLNQFKGFKFYTSDSLASSNYEAGYQQGLKVGSDGAYDMGYDKGYDNGYTLGKSDGFQEGFNQTKQGGFGWLISSVQAFLAVNFFGDFGVGTLLYVCIGCFMFVMVIKIFAR